jgi:hypothetical protein
MMPRADGRRSESAPPEMLREPALIPANTSMRKALIAGGTATSSAVATASATPNAISLKPNAGASNGARLP